MARDFSTISQITLERLPVRGKYLFNSAEHLAVWTLRALFIRCGSLSAYKNIYEWILQPLNWALWPGDYPNIRMYMYVWAPRAACFIYVTGVRKFAIAWIICHVRKASTEDGSPPYVIRACPRGFWEKRIGSGASWCVWHNNEIIMSPFVRLEVSQCLRQ